MSGLRKYLYLIISLALMAAVTASWQYASPQLAPITVTNVITQAPPANVTSHKLLSEPVRTFTRQEKPIKGVPVLMYHKISPDPKIGGLTYRVPPDDFEWQMRYLRENGYNTVDLGAILDYYQNGGRLPDKPIVITIDDGYRDNYIFAFPILKKYDLTATIFVVNNTVGGLNEFDTKAHLQPECEMLTWDEIREMSAAGITIGAHTLDHVHLSKVSLAEAKLQIVESKKDLEKHLGKEIKYFCYPYGEYSRAVVNLVKESGYRAATSVQPGLVTSEQNPYLYNRIAIIGSFDQQRFVQALNKH